MGEVVSLVPRLAGSAVGCDRLSLSFPVVGFDRSAFDKMNGRQTGDGEWEIDTYSTMLRPHPELDGDETRGDYNGAAVMVGLKQVGPRWWGKVETNPSRFVDPAGCGLLPLLAIPDAVEACERAVWGLGVVPAVDAEAWRVKRVDVARDFEGVSAPGFYVQGLAALRRSYNKRSGVWSDAQCGAAQTLHVGSGAGMVRLYDQHAAYADKGADPGRLRWECEARPGWLDRHGVRVVSQLSVGRCEDIAADRWEWSRMGTEVTGAVNVVDRIDRLVTAGGYHDKRTGTWQKMSPAKARRLLGDLVAESLGAAWSSSNDARAEYERLKRHLGVVPSAELFQGADVRVAGRLDFEQGVEILTECA